MTDQLGGVTRYTYDAIGRRKTVTDAESHVTEYFYSATGSVTKITIDGHTVSEAVYDSLGRTTKAIDGEGNSVTYTYDSIGNMKTYTDAMGSITRYEYNKNYQTVKVTDALGNSSITSYDVLGRVTSTTDAEGNTTTYTYDAAGNVLSVTDAEGNSVSYTYDVRGRTATERDKLGSVTTYTYDAKGNVTATKDAYTRDEEGRVTKESYSDGSTTEYAYNAAGLLTLQKEVTKDNETLRQIVYAYDDAGNLTSENRSGVGIERKDELVRYYYDKADQLVKTNIEGVTTSYTYDKAGNLLSDGESAYTYDLQNRLVTRTSADGTTTYSYDKAGNLTREIAPDGITNYTYSAQNKLVKGKKTNGESSTYVYNALGVRIANTQIRTNRNAGNQNADLKDGSHGVDYMRFLKDGRASWQRVWETEIGTTVQSDKETVTRHYVVDYLSIANRDIFVTEDGSYTSRYVYDANGRRISAEFDYAPGTKRGEAGENLQSDISVGIGKVFYRTSILGSTLFAVDKNGEVIAHAIYDPWGNPLTETYTDANHSGLENLNNYTGYTYDLTLALYFAQNRFYDAELHRFTQEDSAKDGTNWYVYCENEPLLRVDLWGKYYIKEETVNGHKEYVAVRQTWLNRFGRSLIKSLSPIIGLGGFLVGMGEKAAGYVGGNSLETLTMEDLTGEVINSVVQKGIEKILEQFAKEAVPYVKAIFYIKDFSEEYFGSIDRVTADDIIFKLLELTSMEIRSKDILIVERKMNYAYQFLKDFEWYFFGRVWVQSQYIRNPSGGFIKTYNYGPTYWEMDLRISKPGWLSSSKSRIEGYVREYYNVLMCSFWSTGKIGPGYLSASKWAEDWSESLRNYLNQYEARLNAILEAFKSYVEQ